MRLSLFAVAALCVSSLAARADTYQLFNINGLLTNGATIKGTFNLDESTAPAVGNEQVDLTYTFGSTSTTLVGTNIGVVGSSLLPPYFVALNFGDTSSPFYASLLFPTLASYSFAGYTGGLCTIATPCRNNVQSNITFGGATVEFASGTSTVAAISAVTPEPSSIALLSTGLLGVAGLMRKRFASPPHCASEPRLRSGLLLWSRPETGIPGRSEIPAKTAAQACGLF